jgi:hypothetical protein
MTDFQLSFYCFVALAILLPWALGLLLWRRIGRREMGIHWTAASMALLAFLIGAVWWTAIHPAIWPSPPPAQPNPNAPPVWGLAILAGVSGIIVQVIGTVTLLVVVALWDRVSPGTFSRLLARLKADERPTPALPPNPEP